MYMCTYLKGLKFSSKLAVLYSLTNSGVKTFYSFWPKAQQYIFAQDILLKGGGWPVGGSLKSFLHLYDDLEYSGYLV